MACVPGLALTCRATSPPRFHAHGAFHGVTSMTFTLPDLPYAHDALAPYMSKETLEFHHDKHHLAYVNNGNNLLKGTEWENKSLVEIVRGSYGKNAGLFNNAGQHYNHSHFWKWMKPKGGGKIPGALEQRADRLRRLGREGQGGFHPGRRNAVRLGLGMALGRRWQDRRRQDAQWREPARRKARADPRRRCLGAFLLHRLPQPSARLSQGVRREPGQLGLRRRTLPRGGALGPIRRCGEPAGPRSGGARCGAHSTRLIFLSLHSSTP